MKEKLSHELSKSKDSAEQAKNRSAWLESHGRDYHLESDRLKKVPVKLNDSFIICICSVSIYIILLN